MAQTMPEEQTQVSHKPCQNCHFRCEKNIPMSFTASATKDEMQRHLRDVVALVPENNRKVALAFAASVLKLDFERARALYYGRARRIEAHEADQIRAYVQQAETLIKARQEYEQRRQEFLANAPRFMAVLAPPALPPVEVREEVAAEVAATSRAAGGDAR
jgi:hypothetical protein